MTDDAKVLPTFETVTTFQALYVHEIDPVFDTRHRDEPKRRATLNDLRAVIDALSPDELRWIGDHWPDAPETKCEHCGIGFTAGSLRGRMVDAESIAARSQTMLESAQGKIAELTRERDEAQAKLQRWHTGERDDLLRGLIDERNESRAAVTAYGMEREKMRAELATAQAFAEKWEAFAKHLDTELAAAEAVVGATEAWVTIFRGRPEGLGPSGFRLCAAVDALHSMRTTTAEPEAKPRRVHWDLAGGAPFPSASVESRTPTAETPDGPAGSVASARIPEPAAPEPITGPHVLTLEAIDGALGEALHEIGGISSSRGLGEFRAAVQRRIKAWGET